MTDQPDIDELEALRGFRAYAHDLDDAGHELIEDTIRARIIDAQHTQSSRPRRRSSWIIRQVPVAAVSALIVIAITSPGSENGPQTAVASTKAEPLLNRSAKAILPDDRVNYGSLEVTPVTSTRDVDTWIYYNRDTGDVAMSPASSPETMDLQTLPPDRIIQGPSSLTPDELNALPVHADALLNALRTASLQAQIDRDRDYLPFRIAAAYVSNPKVPAAARAAFLRALGRLDGVDLAGPGTDLLGRSGVVIARLDAASGVRQEYIFNADNGRVLEQLEFLTEGAQIGDCAMGTMLMIEVYDDEGFPISPASAPWTSWPDVHNECVPA